MVLISGHVDISKSLFQHIGEHDMGGHHNYGFDHGLDARDAKLAKLRTRLSLAERSRNKMEITRLSKEIKRLGQGW